MDSLPEHVVALGDRCIGCGECRKVCPSYRHGGCDPAAVMSGDHSSVTSCIGCGNCSRVCANTDPQTFMLYLINVVKGLKVPDSFVDTGYVMYPNTYDGPEPGWSGDDVHVLPGCVVRCRARGIEYASAVVLNAMGFGCSELPGSTCCMYPAQLWDVPEDEREGIRHRMASNAGDAEIMSLCGGCEDLMSRSGIHIEHIIPFVHRNLGRFPRTAPLGLKVALEPGCTAAVYMDMLRELVVHMGCEVVGGSTGCCGKGSKVSAPLMAERQAECSDADCIVVGCPMCFIKYDRHPDGRPVMHIAELLALALGDDTSLGYHIKPVPHGSERVQSVL